jgi:hypothetical protein
LLLEIIAPFHKILARMYCGFLGDAAQDIANFIMTGAKKYQFSEANFMSLDISYI